jgi:hypothetical protein
MTPLFDIDYGQLHLQVVQDRNAYRIEWKQTRFPRSKKRRMRDKWAKNRDNGVWVKIPRAYQIGRVLLIHPDLIPKLTAMNRRNTQ